MAKADLTKAPGMPVADLLLSQQDEDQDDYVADNPDLWLRPPMEQWTELPLIFRHHWQSWPVVDQAVSLLEVGVFLQAALLWDAMLMDDRLSGCVETRVDALFSNELKLKTPGLAEGEEPSGLQKECNDNILALWDTMLPRETASSVHRWGLGPGVGIMENVWHKDAGYWIPVGKVWHPQNLYWRPDRKSYFLITWDGQIEVKPNNGQWGLYTPYRNHYGFAEPNLVRSLNRLWLQRVYAWRDLARWSEVYSLGVRLLKYPQSAEGTPDKDIVFRSVRNLAAEPTVGLPQPDDKSQAGFELDMLKVNEGTGVTGIIQQIEHCDSSMAVRILGNNLPTEVKSQGSFAATKHQASVMQRGRISADNAKFCSFARQAQVAHFVRFNYPKGVVVPIPYYDVDPPEDKGEEAAALKDNSTALQTLAATTLPIDYEELCGRLGVPLLGKGQKGIRLQLDPSRVPKNKDQKPGKHRVVTAGGRRLPQPMRHGQTYSDELAESSTRLAARLMSGKLGRLFVAVDQATSYDELRAKIKELYAHSSPAEIERLVEQAVALGQLAGMKAAADHHKGK